MEFARAKFEEDIARDFKTKYGEHRATAALAVIVEDESVGRKRMIHDATRGVRVNHRIRCRDKIRAPGAREKKQLLREMMEARQVAFSVVGDIAKAHHRFKHRVEEHGYLGCQIDSREEVEGDPESQTVVNKVGTFGVSCASYWWTRISADTCDPPLARSRVHAGPATLCGRSGVSWIWPLGKNRDTAKLLLHVVAWFPLQVG